MQSNERSEAKAESGLAKRGIGVSLSKSAIVSENVADTSTEAGIQGPKEPSPKRSKTSEDTTIPATKNSMLHPPETDAGEKKKMENPTWDGFISQFQDKIIDKHQAACKGDFQAKNRVLKMELDAIFYPKFDNEQSDQAIRSQMLARMPSKAKKDNGHNNHAENSPPQRDHFLELTVKHSGSLILWNGTTFYSKNSTGNVFSLAAEVLLRQHFSRVWGEDENGPSEVMYQKCVAYLQEHRLALAFECVTSFLGHHGDLPKQDYMVLTAVADLKGERFYTTNALVELAQQWRLPHNDVFVLTSSEACDTFFDGYDAQFREVGHTGNTLQFLQETADVHIPSLYSHVECQGDIMEGLVVRSVQSDETAGHVGGTALEKMKQLALRAVELSKLFRSSSSASGSATVSPLDKNNNNKVLATDLRQLFQSVVTTNEAEQALLDLLRARVSCIAGDSDAKTPGSVPFTYFQPVSSKANNTTPEESFPSIVKAIMSESAQYPLGTNKNNIVLSCDQQTQRLAHLIQTVGGSRWAVECKMFGSTSTNCSHEVEWVCILHAQHDSVFAKYRKLLVKRDAIRMTLFRGFAIKLSFLDEEDGALSSNGDQGENRNDMEIEIVAVDKEPSGTDVSTAMIDRDQQDDSGGSGDDSSNLMLKLKLLPYMVRTFACRNGLDMLLRGGAGNAGGGLSAYHAYVDNLLDKWNVSNSAIAKWRLFLFAWGEYVRDMKKRQQTKGMVDSLTSHPLVFCNDDASKRIEEVPMVSSYYLHHLQEFTIRFYRGDYRSDGSDMPNRKGTFGALVLVTALNLDHAQAIAKCLVHALGATSVKPDDVHQKLFIPPEGLVCAFDYAATIKVLKKLTAKKNKQVHKIVLVTLSSTDEEIREFVTDDGQTESSDTEKAFKKFGGMQKSMTKFQVKQLNLPCTTLFPAWLDVDTAQQELMQSGLILPQEQHDNQMTNDADTAATTSASARANAFATLVQQLQSFGDTLPKPDLRRGMLVYFPLLPGFGKSTLCDALKDASFIENQSEGRVRMEQAFEKQDITHAKESEPQTAAMKMKPRKLIVRVGDAVKEKFWPMVRYEQQQQSSSIFVADKNLPPNTWYMIRELTGRNTCAMAVLPDSSALCDTVVRGDYYLPSTTTAEGSNGDVGSRSTSIYPFSLAFLAACMARVLARQQHSGKLDSSDPLACMVVVRFFSFFRGISACSMQEQLDGMPSGSTLVVPFFRKSCVDIACSDNLSSALEHGIRVQVSGSLVCCKALVDSVTETHLICILCAHKYDRMRLIRRFCWKRRTRFVMRKRALEKQFNQVSPSLMPGQLMRRRQRSHSRRS
jgi:hypothetical protein